MQNEPLIDTTFNVLSDTPVGKDPDSYSPTLRRYALLLEDEKLDKSRLTVRTTFSKTKEKERGLTPWGRS